jgi:hypothetical protein
MRTLTARVATKFIKKSSANLELHIYDFDGTLFRSPEPPEWWDKKALGNWFVNNVSLGRPFLSDKPPSDAWIQSVVRQAKASISNPNVWAVMCTGRVGTGSMNYRIAEILKSGGLDFDEVYLNPNMGSKTAPYKQRTTLDIIKRLPQISHVEIWEDTPENITAVEKVADKLGLTFEGHIINPTPYPVDHVGLEDYVYFLVETGDLSESKAERILAKLGR